MNCHSWEQGFLILLIGQTTSMGMLFIKFYTAEFSAMGDGRNNRAAPDDVDDFYM